MKKEEIRLRVRRLLNGARNVEDLNRLFNWLRFRSHGNPTIKEIGHFAAHQDKREQGISWQRARDIFYNARLVLTVVRAHPDKRPDITLPDYYEALRGSLSLLGPKSIRDGLGFGMKKARVILEGAIRKPPASWQPQENRVVTFLQNRLTVRTVFDQADLFSSLCEVLLKEHLLDQEDVPRLEGQMGFVAMYAVSVMHLCEIDLGDAGTATLHAAVGSRGNIVVAAHMPNVISKIDIGVPLFETDCSPTEWCHPDCEADFSKIFHWDEPIELDELGRLREMT